MTGFTVPLAAKTGDKLWDLELLGLELKQLAAGGQTASVSLAAAAEEIGSEILNILKGRERSGQLVFAESEPEASLHSLNTQPRRIA